MVSSAAQIYRNWEVDGVPSSGDHEPSLAEIREWGTRLEGVISAFTSNGGLIYTTRALLFADLAHAANTMAWVIGDPTSANNGVYQKIGSSGSGSWTRVADLPYSFVSANTVSGANNFSVTTFTPVTDQVLVTFTIASTTTITPNTVSFNGDPQLTIKTNAGFDPDAGALRAGMTLSGFKVGNEFRLITDNVASAILSSMETLRDETSDFRDEANTFADASHASATEAAMYAEMVGAAVYDFNFDSDPTAPGYDWNLE